MAFSRMLAAAALTLGHVKAVVQMQCYYETNCPFSQNWIITELAPLWADPAWRSQISVDFIPFGMAGSDTASGKISCQHGDDECIGNKVSLCAKNSLSREAFTDFVICYEKNIANGEQAEIADAIEPCLPGQAQTLLACAEGGQGETFLRGAGEATRAAAPDKAPYVQLVTIPGYNLFGQTLCPLLAPEVGAAAPPCPGGAAPALRKLSALRNSTLV